MITLAVIGIIYGALVRGPTRREAAGRLFIGQSHGICRTRTVFVYRTGNAGRALSNAQSRSIDRRAVSVCRHDLRAAAHAHDFRVWRISEANALVLCPLCHRLAVIDRLAVLEWFRRRVSDHAGLMDFTCGPTRMDRYDAGGNGRHLGRGIHALDAATRSVRRKDQRSKREAA